MPAAPMWEEISDLYVSVIHLVGAGLLPDGYDAIPSVVHGVT